MCTYVVCDSLSTLKEVSITLYVQAISYNMQPPLQLFSFTYLHPSLLFILKLLFFSPSFVVDGMDFQPVNIDLAFNAADRQRCFTLQLIDDQVPEPLENFTLNLFKLGGQNAVIGQQGQLTVQIADDDSESVHWKCVRERCGECVRERCGECVRERCGECVRERCGEGVRERCGEGVRERWGEGVRERWGEGVREGCGEGVRERWDEGVRERWDEGVRERWGEGVRERWGEGVRERSGEGVRER